VICNERDSEEVVLLTKTGIEVTAPNLVCLYCATGEIRSEDSKNEDELDLNWNLDGNAAQTQKNRTRNADQVNVQLPKEQDVPKYKEEFDIILSQFSAIMYKNFKLILSGRKTLVAQTIFMIVAAIVFWKVGSSLDDSTTDSICPNGTINSNGCEVSIGNDLGNLETRLFDDLQSDYYSASVIDPNRFFQPGHENNYSLFQDLNSSEYFTALKQNFSDILKRDTFSFISDSTCTDRRYYFYDQFHLNYGLRLTAQDIPTIPAITLEMQNAEFSDSTHSFNYKVWYASQKTFDSMGRGALNLPIFLNSSFNERHIRCANAWYGYGSYYNYNFYVQAYQKLLFLKPTNAISNAILRNLTNDRGENDAQISVHLSTLKDLKFARDKVFKESLSIFVLAYSIVFLLAIMFPLSESVYRTVFETEKDLFYFQRLYGVEVWLFWFSQYTFDFCVILFWGIFFLIFNSFFESAFFVNTSKGFMVLSIFLGAHAISCFGIFCSSLFKRANVARYFSLVAVLGSAVFSAFLVDTTLPQATTLVIAIIPTISFGMAFSFATGWNEFKNPSDLALDLSLLMFFGGILFAFVGIVVHTYLYDSMSSLLPKFAKKKAIVDSIERESIDVNADVKNEKEVALSESQRTLKLVGLSKGFRSKNSEKSFYAVKDLFLTVGDSECFGLLGPNGAGKSTTINMLSGYLEPTSGTILVNGNDVFAKKSEIRSKLGVCPQFDVVWPDLTVKDHIYFFAKVKGVVRKSLNGRIHKIAEQLNLDGDCFNKASDTLSGGMRRRLSIAISLVGGPKIWVLDEPTTGLSPDIKRQLWNVISAEKKHGRAIILSTHSMEEAETLCSRIGIVAGGRLKVVGTTNFLKENYGDGYKLSFITLEAVNERKAELLLNNVRNSICASANLGGFIGSSINFILPKHSMDTNSVLRIFELMESRSQKFREENRVMEWGISQTTMEEVFINTVQQKSKAEAVQV
jgi:ABC-type multidrug transport system ATPase subunit